MENMIGGMKEKIYELEKMRNISESVKTAKEEVFIIDPNGSIEELKSSGENQENIDNLNHFSFFRFEQSKKTGKQQMACKLVC